MEAKDEHGGVDELSPEVLRRALKAFKKRLKLTSLDEESRLGYSPLTGTASGVSAIQPPNKYPDAVWEELHRQGKIRNIGHGLYELVKPRN